MMNKIVNSQPDERIVYWTKTCYHLKATTPTHATFPDFRFSSRKSLPLYKQVFFYLLNKINTWLQLYNYVKLFSANCIVHLATFKLQYKFTDLDSSFSRQAICYEFPPFKCLVTFRRSELVLVKLAAYPALQTYRQTIKNNLINFRADGVSWSFIKVTNLILMHVKSSNNIRWTPESKRNDCFVNGCELTNHCGLANP